VTTLKPAVKAAPKVAILTCRNDFHALVVQRGYRELTGTDCVIVETDSFAGSDGMTWRSHRDGRSTVSASGLHHDVDGFDLVWYRRANMPQLDVSVGDPDHRQYVNSSIGAALRGTLETGFQGVWLSHPEASQRAENKLIQLDAAVAAGLTVPRTLVSQNPAAVREFYDAMGGAVVMKALRFSRSQPLLALSAEPDMLVDDDAIRLCPTMFQELVPGERHLRVLAIDNVHAIAVDTPHLDWRPHLDADAGPFMLDESTCQAIYRLLAILGLRMGVLDFKMRGDTPVFLEINPQGQFLFMEGLAGIELVDPFARFLFDTACSSPTWHGN
jgi:hypothetical protein